jgi:NDP-sugar pyrophosphorylase family protein
MQAVILAGGLGTRLRAIVSDRPKPMAGISGKPFLEHQIDYLKRHRVTNFIFCVGYLFEQIQNFFGDGEKWGVKIAYAVEKELLGTAGAIKNAEKLLCGRFLVLNGDSFFDFDLSGFIRFHERIQSEREPCLGSVALTEVPDMRNYGAVTLLDDGRIARFAEKNENANGRGHINAGVYIFEEEILNYIAPAQKLSLERQVFPSLLQAGHALFGFAARGFFVDIGTPSGLEGFQKRVREGWSV